MQGFSRDDVTMEVPGSVIAAVDLDMDIAIASEARFTTNTGLTFCTYALVSSNIKFSTHQNLIHWEIAVIHY